MVGADMIGGRFGKPSMTNLPYELGRSIIDTIMSTPVPDFTDTDREIDQMLNEMKEEDAAGNE